MTNPFDISGRVAVVTGGYGVLGGSIAAALSAAGARVAVLGRRADRAAEQVAALESSGGIAIPIVADVLDRPALERGRKAVLDAWGRVDILVNAAGGNVARARTDHGPAFDMPIEAFDEVVRLNLHGTVLPTLVFAEAMTRKNGADDGGRGANRSDESASGPRGSVINISSMAADRAISGVSGYSAAKAGIDNFTKWMAVDLARRCGDGLRVNAIAPGFFIADQNRDVLVDPDGSYTDRARQIVSMTPMGRFGDPGELNGAVLWLCSDAASFVTGTVIPVDGGFSANSGV